MDQILTRALGSLVCVSRIYPGHPFYPHTPLGGSHNYSPQMVVVGARQAGVVKGNARTACQ